MGTQSNSTSVARPEVWAVVRQLLRHPVRSFVIGWNWKAGVLSVFLRAPVYIGTTLKYGWQVSSMAGAVEAVFAAASAGVYAALTEAVRCAVPEATVATLLLVVLPAVTLLLDALVHYLMLTPNLRSGILVSLAVSVVSSGFSWYSMRRGTLLVGNDSRSFTSDIAALPLLIARFISQPFVLLLRTLKLLCVPALGE